MADTITLSIISPAQIKTVEIEWLEVESPSGSFTITPGHSPVVSMIKNKSSIVFKEKNLDPETLVVSQGIAIVNESLIRIILEQ